MRLLSFTMIVLLSLLSFSANAEPLPREKVPKPLTPWVDWVLQGNNQIDCPYVHNGSSRACVWPSTLGLQLSKSGGFFSQQWRVFGEAFVQLPGETGNWPQQVQSAGRELVVLSKHGHPFVRLEAGLHTISGRFRWERLPKSLLVTPETGLISLMLNGDKIDQPRINNQGHLWLVQGDSGIAGKDNLEIEVYRKIVDSHPIQVHTMLKLRVSGKQRNATLAGAVFDGFYGQQIQSPLPARLNNGNQLELQLRPGVWTVEFISRASADVTQFSMPKSQAPWPEREVWVYQSDVAIRQAKVIGASSIDPSQTQLPEQWKSLPAYLMSSDDSLTLEVFHRGVADSGHDSLSLNRQLWLDYDGTGYTLKDQVTGKLVNSERLDVMPELQLGRVSIDGQGQFITFGDDESRVGVEIRKADVSMVAESRYTGDESTPPVNGWRQNMVDVQTTLHLPPGWRLFTANGTDNIPDSWLQNWSLLDIFLVLVIAISVAYLWGGVWAGFTLLCLVFVWHEPGSPRYIWLVLLALVALLRAVPAGRLRLVLSLVRVASLVSLVLILLPYMIDTIRVGLYPQLENGYYSQHRFSDSDEYARNVELSLDSMARPAQKTLGTGSSAFSYSSRESDSPRKSALSNLNVLDPDSKIQTGFGLPSWQGSRPISLHWSGPVKADESTKLILLGPSTNFVIRVLGIVLLLLLSWRLTSIGREVWPKPSVSITTFLPMILALTLSPLLLMVPTIGQANLFPDERLLESLHTRLTVGPDCLPDCAQIESMQLTVNNAELQLRLRIHAAADTALPLPGKQGQWLPTQVLLNAEPANAVRRDADQALWIALSEGIHDVVLSGALANHNNIAIPLPLNPHYIQWRSLDEHWTIEGVDNNKAHDGQLQINRVSKASKSQDLSSGGLLLPVFVKVERLIKLGLDWSVTTTVTRVAPNNSPIGLNIPLLEGEQVLSESNGVGDSSIKVALSARHNQFSWNSRLSVTEVLKLKAADDPRFLETWKLSVSPIWHVESLGIPRNQTSAQSDTGLTVWRPWPSETLQLDIGRPKGVEGQSVTILSSQMAVLPGKRAKDVELTLNALSSRGVEHDIELPDGVSVQSVIVGGLETRIQQTNNALKLSLTPGKQKVEIKWRDETALGNQFRFPPVDLGIASVNTWFTIRPPSSRWVIWVEGPVFGPAVLYWGVLAALFIFSVGLSASKLTPLKTWQWFLLAVGLSQTEIVLIVVVVAWLIAIAFREKLNKPMLNWQFNMMQLVLLLLTVVSLGVIAVAVGNGLLGQPDMQIVGNGSSSALLNWYQDRSGSYLPQPLMISVPMWAYRGLMLLWALWLAKSVIEWLRWEWIALNVGGLWKKKAVVQANDS